MSEDTQGASAPEGEAAAAPPPPPVVRDAGVADRVFDRLTKRGAAALGGGEIIGRKVRKFILDGQSCAPDFFVDPDTGDYFDVEVTMRGLSSSEEIAALNGVTDAGQVPYLLTRASFYALNGKVVPEDRKDFFWEGFGMQGRQLCLMAFQHIGSASGAAVGKFHKSITVG